MQSLLFFIITGAKIGCQDKYEEWVDKFVFGYCSRDSYPMSSNEGCLFMGKCGRL